MSSLVMFKGNCCWLSTQKVAEKHYGRAVLAMSRSHDPADIYSALTLLEVALKLLPRFDKALELKARALLYLRRFHDVATMLEDYIPSRLLQNNRGGTALANKSNPEVLELATSDCLSPFIRNTSKTLKRLWLRCKEQHPSCRLEKENWRYLVLGQACCHLGMMEDAIILLQKSRRAANDAFRQQSNRWTDDDFDSDILSSSSSSSCSSSSSASSSSSSSSCSSSGNMESDIANRLLSSIKSLLRRRAAAMAALEAGLYPESVRHFSKILEGRRVIPQDFLAYCYLHRAIAFQAEGRYIDAIVDCNRTLSLNPKCTQALSARASIFEMARCFPECLQDLEHLKILYDSLLPTPDHLYHNSQRKLTKTTTTSSTKASLIMNSSSSSSSDFQGHLDYVRNKIGTLRQRHVFNSSPNYHMILGVPRDCSRGDVERAHLLFCLKHRPEKAAQFLDRCELVDGRDIRAVKEEATASAQRLFRLLQRSYTALLSRLAKEEDKEAAAAAESRCLKSKDRIRSNLLILKEEQEPGIIKAGERRRVFYD